MSTMILFIKLLTSSGMGCIIFDPLSTFLHNLQEFFVLLICITMVAMHLRIDFKCVIIAMGGVMGLFTIINVTFLSAVNIAKVQQLYTLRV